MTMVLDGTNSITMPSWTTAGRPSSPAAGQIGYNSTIGGFDMYNGSAWETTLVGTTAGDNAAAGTVGEYVSSQVTAGTTGLTSGTALNATSISLTAGDWDVSGAIVFNFSATTTGQVAQGVISTTSSTMPSYTSGNSIYIATTFTINTGFSSVLPTQRINVTTTTTVYLIGQLTFTGGTAGIGGTIRARRVR